MSRPPKAVSDYMAKLGKKGGETKGFTKKRSAAHYKRMVEARKTKKSAHNQFVPIGSACTADDFLE